jgi:RNA polymerase sigma-70 factor, ECF subfamily
VAQEAFLKAFRNLASFHGESKFSTWLISIALNEARRRLRRHNTVRSRWRGTLKREAKFRRRFCGTGREIPFEVLERREVRALLQKAIEDLSPIYRELLVLRDIEERSIEETADVLAISISWVRVRLHLGPVSCYKRSLRLN